MFLRLLPIGLAESTTGKMAPWFNNIFLTLLKHFFSPGREEEEARSEELSALQELDVWHLGLVKGGSVTHVKLPSNSSGLKKSRRIIHKC